MASNSLQTCIFIVNAGASAKIFDDTILTDLTRRCLNQPNELAQLTMIDLEYLSRCLSAYNSGPHQNLITAAAQQLLAEMRRRLDDVAHRNFYSHFIKIIRNLTIINVYDVELLANIFRPDYIRCIHKKSKLLDLPIYELDGFNRVNLKNQYHGDYLTDAYVDKLRFLIEYIPDRVKRHRKRHSFFYAIEDVVERLFGRYQVAHAIPWRRLPGDLKFSDMKFECSRHFFFHFFLLIHFSFPFHPFFI